MRSNEEQVLRADGLDGIALRYGLVYGPGPASDTLVEGLRRHKLPIVRSSGVLPWVYVDDAAAATVAALEQATPGAAYNITDDEPVSLATLMIVMARAIGAPRPASRSRLASRDGADRAGGRDRRPAGFQHPGQNRTRLDAPGADLPRRHQPPCPSLRPGSGVSRAAGRGLRGCGREGLVPRA